ncbi:eukaryotic translation elongation factor 1 epsilon-1 isoform X1 [Pteropus medius]|uniref:eukaryotic translation elongation factor 1 epsilon-1 isoform X1 n=1 Tax=Pteropus vampyrus TaxID=132908 RepID=UPI00196A3187|nr:eukaryotic translation elongation factor 1 epsilon-1 isoform X1 [Pteropus giganteus]
MAAAAATTELMLLEKSLGLSKGNKYSAQGERQIPVLQTNNGPSLTGLTTIAAHLVKQANKEYLLGSTAEEKAIVQQWLEYRVTRVDGYSNKDDILILLKDLNSYLEDKVYLTGYNFTLADILLYYGLHRFIFRAPMEVCHSFRKKEKVKEIAEQSRTTSHKACPRGSMVPIGKVANHHFTLIRNGSLQVFLTCLHGELVTKNIICLALKFKIVIECQ